MNVNQQLARMRIRNEVEKRFPGQHVFTEHDLNIRIEVRCSCGWRHTEPRQNALARAAKLRRAEREHLYTVLMKAPK